MKKVVQKTKKDPSVKELPFHYKQVLSLIPEGFEKPVTVKEISQLTGIRGVEVRRIVSTLILAYKQPIGTSNFIGKSGYFLITNDEERDQTVANMKSRAMKIWERARALEQIPSNKQIRLF